MRKNKPQQVKILRSSDVERRAIIFTCDSLSTKLSSTPNTIDIEIWANRKRAILRFPRNMSTSMAALLRAMADDLEQT